MNVGGGDEGTWLTVAKVVALRETCAGGTTEECRDSIRGSESYLPIHGRSETERDCGAIAYWRTYCDATKTATKNA